MKRELPGADVVIGPVPTPALAVRVISPVVVGVHHSGDLPLECLRRIAVRTVRAASSAKDEQLEPGHYSTFASLYCLGSQ